MGMTLDALTQREIREMNHNWQAGHEPDEIEALRTQLAAMTKLWENEYRLRCETQARIVEVREHLALAVLYGPPMAIGNVLSKDALATPDDSSALDAALKAERERCAKVCLEMQQGWASDDHIECADAIRSMK